MKKILILILSLFILFSCSNTDNNSEIKTNNSNKNNSTYIEDNTYYFYNDKIHKYHYWDKRIDCKNSIYVSNWNYLCIKKHDKWNSATIEFNWINITDNAFRFHNSFSIYNKQYVYINSNDNWVYLNDKKIDELWEKFNSYNDIVKISKWKLYYNKWNSLYKDWVEISNNLYKKNWNVKVKEFSKFDWDNYVFLDNDKNIILNWKKIKTIDSIDSLVFEWLSWDKLLYHLDWYIYLNDKLLWELGISSGKYESKNFVSWDNIAYVEKLDWEIVLKLNWKIIYTLDGGREYIIINDLKWDKLVYSIIPKLHGLSDKRKVKTLSVWLNNFTFISERDDYIWLWIRNLKIINWEPIFIYNNDFYIWNTLNKKWIKYLGYSKE